MQAKHKNTPAYRFDHRGLELAARNQHEEALVFFRRALAANNRLPDVHVHLGNSLLVLGRDAEARAVFEAAMSLEPRCAEAYNGLGAVENRAGNRQAAILHFSEALVHDPRFAVAESNLGYALAELGDLEFAAEHFRRAIILEPRNPRHYRLLFTVQPEAIEPRDVETLMGLAKQSQSLRHANRIELHFALAAILAEQGKVDEAFTHLEAGNKEKRRDISYDEARELGLMQTFRRAFTPQFIAGLRTAGNPSTLPIFIFGMPRSGTTLAEQILAAHPDVKGAGEIQLFDKLIRENPPLSPSASIEQIQSTVSELGRRYVAETARLADGREHVVDKTLLNFLFAPLIHGALPNARMIHVRRDALDTCWSCYATLFTDKVPFAYDLAELGRYYREYENVMESWRNVLPPDRLLEIRYEELVSDFERQARSIVDFCGLTWDPSCLEFHKAKRAVSTASFAQVRRPLYGSSVGKARQFRHHLDLLAEHLKES